MARVKEALDGGLYDGPDPAQLGPGQLSYIQNAVYRPSSPALRRAPGRVTLGTATTAVSLADDLTGLRDIQFDNSAGHYLIGHTSGVTPSYVTGFVGDTITFGTTPAELTAGSGLEVVQFENSYYLMNGTKLPVGFLTRPNSNVVAYLSATAASSLLQIRQHGMYAVSATMGVTTSTIASALSVSGEGYLEYWTTEVIKFNQDNSTASTATNREIESTFAGTPRTYFISASVAEGALLAPYIEMPPLANASATHWRIYRSPFKVHSSDRLFPAGLLVGDQSVTATSFVDTVTTTSTNFTAPAGGWFSSGWASTGNILGGVGDGSYASVTGNGLSVPYIWPFGSLMVTGMNFGGFAGSVRGIEVAVTGGNLFGNAQGFIRLGKKGDAAGHLSHPLGTRSFTVTANGHTLTLGGASDRWVPLEEGGFTDTDFTVDFVMEIFGSIGLRIDAVKIKAYYGAGLNESAIIPFPTVVYTFGFETSQVGRNGTPPSSRTGDVFEDQMVVNDESNASLIRYSYPGKPDYFPETYFIDFETRDNDKVQCIKVVNNRIVVMMDRSTYRVNYLPSERDASFDRGKAIEPISQTYGCINPMCACTFSLDDSNQILAFVSQKGIHTTDGFSFNTLTDNINWRNILSLTSTSRAIALVNDPEAKVLKFLYRNDANTENFKILELSYADRHATKEELKIAGQINMRNWNATIGSAATPGSVWCVPRNSGDTMTVIGYGSATGAGGGMVYRENGTTIPALDPNMAFATRRMFLGGEGGEVRLNEVYGYIGSYTNSIGVAVSAKVIKTNDDSGEQTKAAKDQLYGGRFLGKWQMNQIAEGVRLSAVVSGNPNNDVAWDYLLLDGIGFGEEDSGK